MVCPRLATLALAGCAVGRAPGLSNVCPPTTLRAAARLFASGCPPASVKA